MPIIRSALRRDWVRDFLYLTLFVAILYGFWLGGYPFFTPDEGRYAEVAREMVASGDYITPRVNGVAFLDKPVLYYWLQAAAINLFGIKEWAIRLFPALLGMFGCLATYSTGRLLFNRRTGILSAIMLATAPLYFIGAHYANLDLEVAVFISCTLLFFISGLQSTHAKQRKYLFLAAYTCAALAFLTKGLIGIVFPSMIIGAWILLSWRWHVLKKIHLLSGLLLFLIIAAPWYILVQKANPAFLQFFFVTQQFSRFVSSAEFNNQNTIWFYVPVVIVGFLPWSIFAVQAIAQSLRRVWLNRHHHPVELFLLLWFFLIFIFFSIPHSKIVTYILPVFPALALLTGHWLDKVWDNAQPKNIAQNALAFIIFAVFFAVIGWLLSYFKLAAIPANFMPHLVLLSCLFIVSAIMAYVTGKQKTLLPLFSTYAASIVLSMLVLTTGIQYLNQNSTKNLVAELKTVIQPQDEVINYFKFYQDVPLYLGKKVMIVADWQADNIASKDNWRRELWLGMPFQDTQQILINEEVFWRHWNSDQRVFVFLNENYFGQFKERAESYFNLGQENDIILLSNQPTVIGTV